MYTYSLNEIKYKMCYKERYKQNARRLRGEETILSEGIKENFVEKMLLEKGSVEFKQKSVSEEIQRDSGKETIRTNDTKFLFVKSI